MLWHTPPLLLMTDYFTKRPSASWITRVQGPKEVQGCPLTVLSHAALHRTHRMVVVCGPTLNMYLFFHIVQGVACTENKKGIGRSSQH